MANVILAPSDRDQELYQKILETASQQNIPVVTFQRNILCDILNLPKDYDSNATYHLLHETIYKRSIEQNIPVKSIVRSHLRDYFDMPARAKLQYEKKGWPLQQREKRFQVLSFLVTVDAATMQEIADQLKCSKKRAEGVLSFNSHYFEKFCIPYDRQRRWRVTELGKKDYFAISGQIKTVNESKVEEVKSEVKEAEKAAERRRKFELLEQKRKKLDKTTKNNSRTRHVNVEQEIEQEKRGIQKYFSPDPRNPTDVEIVQRVEALGRDSIIQQERFCKSILVKRLSLRAGSDYRGVDELIEKKLLERCQKKGKTRNGLVRELFCAHFNIKMK